MKFSKNIWLAQKKSGKEEQRQKQKTWRKKKKEENLGLRRETNKMVALNSITSVTNLSVNGPVILIER